MKLMADEDVKKITKAFDERFKLLLGEIARIKNETSDSKTTQFRHYTELAMIGKDIARIDSTLETLSENVGKHTRKLDALWDQTERITLELEGIKDNQKTALKTIDSKVEYNSDNTYKLNKRLTTVEGNLGIAAPPELTIVR